MDIGMILIQVKDGAAQVVRCEEDGEGKRLVPAANVVELTDQAAEAVAAWFNRTLDQDGLYLCTDQLQEAAEFPPLVLPADAITLGVAGRMLYPDVPQRERWKRVHELRTAPMLRIYRVGVAQGMTQYISRAAAKQLVAQQAG